MLYAAHNVLMGTEDKAGYALLKCIASYLHIDMYVSLDVHTESTIAAGEEEVLVFQKCLEVCGLQNYSGDFQRRLNASRTMMELLIPALFTVTY
jgi:hypothetical protein